MTCPAGHESSQGASTTLLPDENAINRHRAESDEYVGSTFDWFVEPVWATELLLERIPFTGDVLDPAAGEGRIVRTCLGAGLDAWGSDIVQRAEGIRGDIDFTAPDAYHEDVVANVITNPPYYGAKGTIAFVERALRVARDRVAVIAPIPFLASKGRHELFKRWPVTHVLVLSSRPSMPPGGLGIKETGGKEDYVWIVMQRGYKGPREIDWLIRKDKA